MLDWLMDSDRRMTIFFDLIITTAIVGAIAGSIHEERQWNAFAIQHKCVEVAQEQIPDQVMSMVGSSSNGPTFGTVIVPGRIKRTYSCNNGKLYTR